MDCLFCKIADGQIPSYTIYEDKWVKCFLDIHPESNGHLLIIPKQHFLDLDDIDLDTLNKIMVTAKKMKKLLEQKLNPIGIVILQNNGIGQDIKHFHLHLKPVYSENKIKLVEEIFEKLK